MSDTTTKKQYKRKPHHNVYKPLQKADQGAALQFSFDADKRAIFLEAARQKGAKLTIGSKEQFDWEGKIVFKIGVADIGRLLLLFNGRTTEAKCLHSQAGTGRTSVLEVTRGEYDGAPNFLAKLSRTADGQTKRVSMYLNQDEISILAHFIRESLTRMMGFPVETELSEVERKLGVLYQELQDIKGLLEK
jgi:hypothetical protein